MGHVGGGTEERTGKKGMDAGGIVHVRSYPLFSKSPHHFFLLECIPLERLAYV